MVIKRKIKRFSRDFIENIFLGWMSRNYWYWIEDKNGNKVTEDFTLKFYHEHGPFIILGASATCKYVLLKDCINDSFLIKGDVKFNTIRASKLWYVFNSDGESYLIDLFGKIREQNFSIVKKLYDGYIIKKGNLLGYMSYDGDITITPKFKKIKTDNCNSNTFIGECSDNSKILMSVCGNKLSEKLFYTKITPLNNSFLLVKDKFGSWGVVKPSSEIIIPTIYEEIKPIISKPNLLFAKKNNNYGVIDINGNIVKNFTYRKLIDVKRSLFLNK